MTARRGFTLIELLVSMVILGVIGVAVVRLYVAQSRFYDLETQLRRARFVSRTAVSVALADLRMVEPTGGVVSATNTSLTVRVPYALGIVCANTASQTTLALFPVDSVLYASAGFTGYAWRDSLGTYNYVESGVSTGADNPAVCTGANVTVLANGKVIYVKPPLPAGLPATVAVGSAVLLFQRITYSFLSSGVLPGRTGLWRTIVGTSQTDELVAPFDSSAKFRFFVQGSDTAQTGVPSPLSTMRGIQLNLRNQSERPAEGQSAPRTAQIVTGIFFNNVIK